MGSTVGLPRLSIASANGRFSTLRCVADFWGLHTTFDVLELFSRRTRKSIRVKHFLVQSVLLFPTYVDVICVAISTNVLTGLVSKMFPCIAVVLVLLCGVRCLLYNASELQKHCNRFFPHIEYPHQSQADVNDAAGVTRGAVKSETCNV